MNNYQIRLAEMTDVATLEALIPRSAFGLQQPDYSEEQIQAALGPVFGVDRQLIADNTFYVATTESAIVGCGGWSFRKSRFGGDADRTEPDPKLDPTQDPARIRAFFVDPAHARQGIGGALLRACENAITEAGFTHVEIAATLAGAALYSRFGYQEQERFEIPVTDAPSLPCVRLFKQFPNPPGN